MDRQCPTCSGYLSLVEQFQSHSDDNSLFGCRECNTLYRYNEGAVMGGPNLRKQRQTLTEYEAEIADRPQAEIRRKREVLDKDLETLAINMKTAKEAFEVGQSSYHFKLTEIQKDCKHPNFKRTAITKHCKDCGAFGVTGV